MYVFPYEAEDLLSIFVNNLVGVLIRISLNLSISLGRIISTILILQMSTFFKSRNLMRLIYSHVKEKFYIL